MRSFIYVLVAASLVMLSSCKKNDPASPADSYTNKLTLGTGASLSTFALTGEGASFDRLGGVAVIYWRLESAADFGGAGISIKIEKQSGSTYTAVGTYPYANPQNYGHIVISSISVSDAGTFRATGMLTATSAVVATTTFTVH
jgi:hypothetical protein